MSTGSGKVWVRAGEGGGCHKHTGHLVSSTYRPGPADQLPIKALFRRSRGGVSNGDLFKLLNAHQSRDCHRALPSGFTRSRGAASSSDIYRLLLCTPIT